MSTLSVAQAAELMKVHKDTLLDMIHAGVIPAAKIGRSYVMLENDVMNYITSQIKTQTAQRQYDSVGALTTA